MPYYAGLKQIKDATVRKRTIAGLQRLRLALAAAIPPRTATDTLLLATRVRQLIAGGVLRLQYKQRLSAGISIFL